MVLHSTNKKDERLTVNKKTKKPVTRISLARFEKEERAVGVQYEAVSKAHGPG
jgi:hypothetical protein